MGYMLDEPIKNYLGMNYTTNYDMFVIENGKNAVIQSIANIIDGDIDVYIEDERVVKCYTEATGLAQYIKDAGSITKEKTPIYIAFSKDVPFIEKYMALLEEGIGSLKHTGDYKSLRKKYNMDNNTL
jgi:hypothetical protein